MGQGGGGGGGLALRLLLTPVLDEDEMRVGRGGLTRAGPAQRSCSPCFILRVKRGNGERGARFFVSSGEPRVNNERLSSVVCAHNMEVRRAGQGKDRAGQCREE